MIVKCDYCGKEFKKSPSRVTRLNFDCKACYIAYCDENKKTNKIEVNINIAGVNFRKDNKKWRARLRKDNKDIFNKCFDTIEEAIQARKQALEVLNA